MKALPTITQGGNLPVPGQEKCQTAAVEADKSNKYFSPCPTILKNSKNFYRLNKHLMIPNALRANTFRSMLSLSKKPCITYNIINPRQIRHKMSSNGSLLSNRARDVKFYRGSQIWQQCSHYFLLCSNAAITF